MPLIRIKRSSEYINSLRDYVIFFNGNEAARVGNGQGIEFQVPAGQHSVYAKIDWCSSPTQSVYVAENETFTFTVSGFKKAKLLLSFGFLPSLLVMALLFVFRIESLWLLLLLLPGSFMLIYYLSFGRKQYLQLLPEGSK